MNQLLAQVLRLPGDEPLILKGPLDPKKFITFGQITVGSIISSVLKFVFPLAGIGLLIMILSAGFTLLTSAGDTKKMEKGKQTLTYAVVGFLIIFVAYWITQLLGTIFGIGDITNIFKM